MAGLEERLSQALGVPVTVERKAIKNLYLRLQADGVVRLTAPRRAAEGLLYDFALSKRDWLLRRQTALVAADAPRWETGEHHPLWGVFYPLEVTAGSPSIALQGGILRLTVPAGGTAESRKALVDGLYRRELAAALPAVIDRCEAIAGVHASGWQLRDMTSRWGSCTPATRRIRVNVQLAKFPPDCLSYLVLHELTHLLERGHTAAFYAQLETFCPDWRSLRRTLNGGGFRFLPAAGTIGKKSK
ncbi:MAG: SprT family zinc-dependent metalloprotease [Oscillospiraceae bacterium]